MPGLEICSHLLSPIVFLKLKNPTGSLAADLDLLETIADQVSFSALSTRPDKVYINFTTTYSHTYFLQQALKEDSVFIVASKRSSLDRCMLPLGIRLFVSAGHTESDISKACSSLKRISSSVLV